MNQTRASRSPFFFLTAAALTLALTGLAAGCSDDGSDDTGPTTTTTTTGTGGTGGTGGGDCQTISLDGIELVSMHEDQFDASDSVPVIRTPGSLANLSGDPASADRLRILFDGDLGVGVHAMDGDPNQALPDYAATFVPNCTACAVLQEDRDPSNAYLKTYTVSSGELEITDMVTPHQTAGVARNLELREVEETAEGTYAFVPGGTCYRIQEATFDVRLPNGCKPFVAGSCPADQYCMPLNAVGTDGQCVTGGDVALGEPCTRASTTSWDSDCQLGLRCIGDTGEDPTCQQVCDVLSATPGCPSDTLCGGGYSICMDVSILQNSGTDDALVGEVCATDPEALYCGGAGQRGLCYDDDGDGALESMCVPFSSAPSQCPAGRTAGYVAYKAGIDRSTLFCIPPL
ncbi:hypothetical protein [Chondromyces apiculatus]|uniref:Putative lipoprotein n=1 Tax=Chondromyces apiculatus DSM 436 TaxID=1192034 RepID=A0A017T249_9BACT|nr:hypothetical protein [Chondromyces apiculatus]EYF03323.1 putative lipoprotein [Chondromyces apiculatus DSM 436]